MSTNPTQVMTAAQEDADSITMIGGIDLKNISEAEARKLMSIEHKALGYRPPPGSLAAEAQAEAAKYPESRSSGLHETQLVQAAISDAVRILEKRTTVIDLTAMGEGEARKLMSEEHRVLGHRPPSGSLAAAVQSSATGHPNSSARIATRDLQRAALGDAVRIGNGSSEHEIDLNYIGEAEARRLMSEEHKALGYRPPPGSLAAEAQSAASKHPHASSGADAATLTKVALQDAKTIETRRLSISLPTAKLDLNMVNAIEVHVSQSEEQKTIGYCSPVGSLTAKDQIHDQA